MNINGISLDELVNLPYEITVNLEKSGDGYSYVAYVTELEGCMAMGNTWQEAIENLKIVKRDYIELCQEQGWEIPYPLWQNIQPCQFNIAQIPKFNSSIIGVLSYA